MSEKLNTVPEVRKGIFTPEQEEIFDLLYENSGIMEKLDGAIIKTIDNVIIEKLKAKIPIEYLPTLYQIIDEVMNGLRPLVTK